METDRQHAASNAPAKFKLDVLPWPSLLILLPSLQSSSYLCYIDDCGTSLAGSIVKLTGTHADDPSTTSRLYPQPSPWLLQHVGGCAPSSTGDWRDRDGLLEVFSYFTCTRAPGAWIWVLADPSTCIFIHTAHTYTRGVITANSIWSRVHQVAMASI
jgi:hypothetical protein